MNPTLHPGADRLQDWLEGLMGPAETDHVRAHVEGCVTCQRDLALYREVFAALAAVPLYEPSPELDANVLARVLPWRRRRHQLAVLGWGYAALASVSAALAAVALGTAPGRHYVEQVTGTVSHAVLQATLIAFNGMGYVTLHAAAGWARVAAFGLRFEPIAHALRAAFGQPQLVLLVSLAIALTVATIGWLKPRWSGEPHRPGQGPGGIPHVLLCRF